MSDVQLTYAPWQSWFQQRVGLSKSRPERTEEVQNALEVVGLPTFSIRLGHLGLYMT